VRDLFADASGKRVAKLTVVEVEMAGGAP